MTPPHLVDTTTRPWVPLGPGLSFRPLAFGPGEGRQLLLRLEPGTVIPRHRHTGEVHAFTLAGVRRIAGHDADIAAGAYVYEPAGNVDSWSAVGDEPCVVHVALWGRLEELDDEGRVVAADDTASLRRTYLDWCAANGVEPDPNVEADR